MTGLLIALQAVQVAFLAFHDWVQVGRLNDVAAVRAADSRARLLTVTLLSALPFGFGLAASLWYARSVPQWLIDWLWVTYVMLFIGQLRAWWLPYLGRKEPERAARYRAMFGRTHAFLPARNGITPNTLHILLHVATLATLLVLAFGDFS